MIYLRDGLAELGWPRLGKTLAVIFAVMCIGGSFGGGNMFQSNQSFAQISSVLPFMDNPTGAIVFGLLLAGMVGLVIIGGVKRIGEVASVLVPGMCVLYITCAIAIPAAERMEPSTLRMRMNESKSSLIT